MKRAGEAELESFLKEIDARLEGERADGKIDLFLLGGAAAVIAYGLPRGTIDIDAYLEDAALRAKLVALAGEGTELADRHGIYFQPANTSLMLIEEPEWRQRSREILKKRFKRLRVLAIGKEDLILSKLARYNDRDREDIRYLAENGRMNVKQLIAFYQSARKYFVGNLATLDQTFEIVLEEHFGRRKRRTRPRSTSR